ncbi:MAG: hypothetical protein KA144_10200 [Xanthomonadaceae bacterium]|nr:hypothetical protein [Xanthomonadaceae bacterium]
MSSKDKAFQNPISFENLGEKEKKHLKNIANEYILAAKDPDEKSSVIDYKEFSGIMMHLAKRTDLDDLKKAFVWSEIADAKGKAEGLKGNFAGGKYQIELDGVNPQVIDSGLFGFRRQNTPGHNILSFADGYHGFGKKTSEISMGYETKDSAYKRIEKKEGWNPGDAHNSKAMVDAFHAYKDAPQNTKFNAFSEMWMKGMLSKDAYANRIDALKEINDRMQYKVPIAQSTVRMDQHGAYIEDGKVTLMVNQEKHPENTRFRRLEDGINTIDFGKQAALDQSGRELLAASLLREVVQHPRFRLEGIDAGNSDLLVVPGKNNARIFAFDGKNMDFANSVNVEIAYALGQNIAKISADIDQSNQRQSANTQTIAEMSPTAEKERGPRLS